MPTDPVMTRRAFFRGRFLRPIAERVLAPAETRLRAATDAARAVLAPPELAPASPQPAPAPPANRPLALPILRPPGALPESEFLAACTRCGACATACPYQAIVPAHARFRHAAGTPMIDPANAACHMCPDAPCIAACEPRVLRVDRPRKMGTATIQTWNCLAHTGSFCTTCAERCPIEGAITLTAGRPRVNDAACTGCGVCQNVCPAPANAVLILPLRDRPPLAPQETPADARH